MRFLPTRLSTSYPNCDRIGSDPANLIAGDLVLAYVCHMQIQLADWPEGLCREIASIDATSVRRSLDSLLKFERSFDDLDGFIASVFTIRGVLFALQLYDNIPTGDFTLIVNDNRVDDTERLAIFLAATGIRRSDVTWVRSSGT